jgi:ATP-dependent DNA helicase RecG
MPTAALLTGSVTGKDRTRIYSGLKDGSISIAVGTHALVNKDLEFRRLGLAVVDEQHRQGEGS